MRMCFCSTSSSSSSLLWSAMHISQKHSQFYTSQLPLCICSCQPAPFWQVLRLLLLSTPTNPSTVVTTTTVPVPLVQCHMHCPGSRDSAAMQRSQGAGRLQLCRAFSPRSSLCCSGSQASETQLRSTGVAKAEERAGQISKQ